jgi:hypothetical protein
MPFPLQDLDSSLDKEIQNKVANNPRFKKKDKRKDC